MCGGGGEPEPMPEKFRKYTLNDIPPLPKIEGVASVSECCSELWGLKEEW